MFGSPPQYQKRCNLVMILMPLDHFLLSGIKNMVTLFFYDLILWNIVIDLE